MKKVLALCSAVIMMLVCSLTAFAAPGSFVDSPSRNNGPVLIEGVNESEDCDAVLVITPYKDRESLTAKALSDLEKAYQIIANCTDLTTLNAEFAAFVKSKGIDPANLAVSDLFDISYFDCDIHDGHGKFRIKLSAETLENFVGLLHYKDGEWEFISNARVLEDGETLEFSVGELSPFAIVVEKDAGSTTPPHTGDVNFVLPLVMLVCSFALIVVLTKLKKKSA